MLIQDPIHGYIRLNDLEADLVGSSTFQRLRRIRQLGCTHLIYPSTTHTRFEHSLGATYLAGRFADYLDLDDRDTKHLRTAALLHDVGHGPFSHVSEQVMEKHDRSHESFSKGKIDKELRDILERYDVDVNWIQEMVDGQTELGSVIAGDIDVDRMDYLMRDSHYSGVAHGTIDEETIMRAATIHEGRVVFDSKFKQAMEGLLTARYLMIPTVYMHRSVVRAEKMLERAIEEMVSIGAITIDGLAEMDDVDLTYRLRHADSERAQYLNQRLDDRKLFKTALRWDEGDIGRKGLKEIGSNIDDERALEEEIADEAGVPVKDVLLNAPNIPARKEVAVSVLDQGDVVSLDDISRLTQAVYGMEWEQVAVEVYAAPEQMGDVGEAAARVLKDRKRLLRKFL